MLLTTEEAFLRVGSKLLLTLTPTGPGLYWESDVKKIEAKRVRRRGECAFILHPGFDQMTLPDDWPKSVPWTYCKSPVEHGPYCAHHWSLTHRGVPRYAVQETSFQGKTINVPEVFPESNERQRSVDRSFFARLAARG